MTYQIEVLQKAASHSFGISWEEAISINPQTNKISRLTEHVMARRLFFAGIRKFIKNPVSLKEMGRMCGNSDHSTVIHALQKHKAELETYEDYRQTWINFCKLVETYLNDELSKTIHDSKIKIELLERNLDFQYKVLEGLKQKTAV